METWGLSYPLLPVRTLTRVGLVSDLSSVVVLGQVTGIRHTEVTSGKVVTVGVLSVRRPFRLQNIRSSSTMTLRIPRGWDSFPIYPGLLKFICTIMAHAVSKYISYLEMLIRGRSSLWILKHNRGTSYVTKTLYTLFYQDRYVKTNDLN